MLPIAGVWAFLSSPLGRYGLIAVAVLAAWSYAEHRGENRARAECQEAALRAELAGKTVDTEAAQEAADAAGRETARINSELKAEQKKLADYAAKLKDTCVLGDDGAGARGCASQTAVAPPVSRQLPAASSVVLGPVAEPQWRANRDARVVAREYRAALRAANSRLRASKGIYGRVRARYEAGK